MNNSRYFVYAGYLVLALIFIYGVYSLIPEKETNPESGFPSQTIGSTGPDDVIIELLPLQVTDTTVEIEITMNTHSVNLSQFDLGKLVTLEFDEKKIHPIQYPELGGHHVSGTMVFAVEEKPQRFRVIITDIPQLTPKIFQW